MPKIRYSEAFKSYFKHWQWVTCQKNIYVSWLNQIWGQQANNQTNEQTKKAQQTNSHDLHTFLNPSSCLSVATVSLSFLYLLTRPIFCWFAEIDCFCCCCWFLSQFQRFFGKQCKLCHSKLWALCFFLLPLPKINEINQILLNIFTKINFAW